VPLWISGCLLFLIIWVCPTFCGVLIAQCLIFCITFLLIIVFLFVHYIVVLWFMASDYLSRLPFSIIFLASSSFLHACTFSTLNTICASHIKLANFSIYLKRLYRYETLKPKQNIYFLMEDRVGDWKQKQSCVSVSFLCTISRK
jgi:hypothetical protein